MSGACRASQELCPAKLEARVSGTLTPPRSAALLCERVERGGTATVGDVQALYATADRLAYPKRRSTGTPYGRWRCTSKR